MTVSIDLCTKAINDSANIWRVYPGTSRDLFKSFQDNDCVYLEVPGAGFRENEIKHKSSSLLKIAIARAIANWHLTPKDARGASPSRNPADYLSNLDKRTLGPAYANLHRLYVKAKPGDIVIVPESSFFESRIAIGEIVRPFTIADKIKVKRFGNEDVPVRKVNWLTTEFRRRLLSPELSNDLGGRRAVKPISREKFGIEIFRIAYGNFFAKENCQYEFQGGSYHNDPMAMLPGIRVISFAFAVASAIEAGEKEELRNMSYGDIAKSDYQNRFVENFEIRFSSPGEFRVWIKNAKVLSLALVVLGSLSADATSQDKIFLTNSFNGTSTAVLPQKEKYKDVLDVLSQDGILNIAKTEYQNAEVGIGLDMKINVTRE